jgi:hypothetical protein
LVGDHPTHRTMSAVGILGVGCRTSITPRRLVAPTPEKTSRFETVRLGVQGSVGAGGSDH